MNPLDRLRRCGALGGVAALLVSTSSAYAEAPRASLESRETVEAYNEVVAEEPSADDSSPPWLGLVLDAGVPDGANLGLVARPLPWLRAHIGGSYNLMSGGIRGGVAYVPFQYWIVPTLVLEGGHYFTGSAKDAIETVAGISVDYAPDRVSYTYANAHLGLEFGGDWFTFFLRGGYSFVHASLRPAEEEDNVRFEEDITATAWLPSAKLGFIFYVY